MDRESVFTKLSNIIRDVFDDESLQITDSTTAEDVAEWDSTNHVRLMVTIEAEFGIRFETEEMTSAETVGQLVDLVLTKLQAVA